MIKTNVLWKKYFSIVILYTILGILTLILVFIYAIGVEGTGNVGFMGTVSEFYLEYLQKLGYYFTRDTNKILANYLLANLILTILTYFLAKTLILLKRAL